MAIPTTPMSRWTKDQKRDMEKAIRWLVAADENSEELELRAKTGMSDREIERAIINTVFDRSKWRGSFYVQYIVSNGRPVLDYRGQRIEGRQLVGLVREVLGIPDSQEILQGSLL